MPNLHSSPNDLISSSDALVARVDDFMQRLRNKRLVRPDEDEEDLPVIDSVVEVALPSIVAASAVPLPSPPVVVPARQSEGTGETPALPEAVAPAALVGLLQHQLSNQIAELLPGLLESTLKTVVEPQLQALQQQLLLDLKGELHMHLQQQLRQMTENALQAVIGQKLG
jgi:hypothetical protein